MLFFSMSFFIIFAIMEKESKKQISWIDSLTQREGTLVSYPIREHDHPYHWKAFEESYIGRKYFVYHDPRRRVGKELWVDPPEWFVITLSYDDIYKLSYKKNPKKIMAEIYHTQLGKEKSPLRMIDVDWVFLEDIHQIVFVDKETEIEISIGNVQETMDFFRPNDDVIGYWHFNPWAVGGTGFKDWSNPHYVNIKTIEFDIQNFGGPDHVNMDLFDAMKRSEENYEKHLQNLTGYTGIEYNK